VLPLDLHVLSLPLAFILSQDQTLHCIKILKCSKIYYFLNLTSRIFAYLSFFASIPSKNFEPPFSSLLSSRREAAYLKIRFSEQKGVQRYIKFCYPPNKVFNNFLTFSASSKNPAGLPSNGTAKVRMFFILPSVFETFFIFFSKPSVSVGLASVPLV